MRQGSRFNLEDVVSHLLMNEFCSHSHTVPTDALGDLTIFPLLPTSEDPSAGTEPLSIIESKNPQDLMELFGIPSDLERIFFVAKSSSHFCQFPNVCRGAL